MLQQRGIPIIVTALVAAMTAMVGHNPRLVWNATASAPVGLYALVHQETKRGDLALVRTPQTVRSLAATRGYLPANVPLVKRIVAERGDVVCGEDARILINAKTVALRQKRDHSQRLLPSWFGCQRLMADQVFLLMATVPDSFDGRYFGPVSRTSIIGKLVPLWTR
jgi:conjugative transfer signal peptidase TraF